MDATLLLARVLGIFLVIAASAVLIRHRWFMEVFADLPRDGLARMIWSLLELLGGLFLLVAHNDWSSLPAAIITLAGWLTAIEGALLLLLPDPAAKRYIALFSKPAWYIGGAVLGLLAGACLAAFGFGLFGPA